MTDNTQTLHNALAENERLKKQLDIAMKALEKIEWQLKEIENVPFPHRTAVAARDVAQQAIEDVEKVK